MIKETPEINSFFSNNCKEHTNIYINRQLPCPYPTCEHGVNSNKITKKSILNDRKTIYIRKSFNGIKGNKKFIWIREDEYFIKPSEIIDDEIFHYFQYKENIDIYHYTNLDTLFKILESNELWLTEWMCTNDKLEIQHGLEIVNKFCNNKIDINQKINKNSYFMASFSYEVNKVTLFSIYANNAEGIAIGFDTKHDWQNIKKNFWIKNYDFMKLIPIIYDEDIQQKIVEYSFYIHEVIKKWIVNSKQSVNVNGNPITNENKIKGLESMFIAYIEKTIAFFKHSAFSDEREVRWLYTYDNEFIEKYKLHIEKKQEGRKNYYTSTDAHDMGFDNYYEFNNKKHKIKLPIKSIILGSRVADKENVINQIKDKCKKFGFQDIEVKISDLPYQ